MVLVPIVKLPFIAKMGWDGMVWYKEIILQGCKHAKVSAMHGILYDEAAESAISHGGGAEGGDGTEKSWTVQDAVRCHQLRHG